MSKLVMSKYDAHNYIKKGKKWVLNHPEHSILKTTRILPYIIIAEYIANQDNKTILIIKRKKENQMSELLKEMKIDLKKAMKREIELRKSNDNESNIYEVTIAAKDVVRSVISMFPEINVKPNKSSDNDTIKLIKKYIFIEKTRELYIQKFLTEDKVKGLSSIQLNKLTKETITTLGDKLKSPKIQIAQTYLPKEPDTKEIIKWIKENINFDDYKNRMQAMRPIMDQFKGIDGNKVKKIILEIE